MSLTRMKKWRYCPRQITSSLTAQEWRDELFWGKSTAHEAPTVFNPFQKVVSFKQWSKVECQKFLTEMNCKRTQNLTWTEVISLRETMYSCSHDSRCFWNMHKVIWPFRYEPSSGRTVPTTAACSVRELTYHVIWTHTYPRNCSPGTTRNRH